MSHSLGALLHVGQSEYEAGRVAGDTMRKLGGNKALCINHELGNVGLDLRCKGFIDGFAGSVEVMPVDSDPAKAGAAIAKRLADEADIDVALALNATIAGEPAVAALKTLPPERKVRVGTFDVTDALAREANRNGVDPLFARGGHYSRRGNDVVGRALASSLPEIVNPTCR